VLVPYLPCANHVSKCLMAPRILEACNQKLESSKCKYHAIHFNFDEEGAPTMAIDEASPHPIVVTDGEGYQLEMNHQPSNVEIPGHSHQN